MTLPMNPVDHPICLATPAHLPPDGTSIEHLPFVMWLVDMLRPRTVVEIGTRDGAAFFACCQVVASRQLDARCHGLLLRERGSGMSASEVDVAAALQVHHSPRYGHFSTLRQADAEDALAAFDEASIDILLIDLSHPLVRLASQLARWLPKLSRTGVVLVRAVDAPHQRVEAREAWSILRDRHPGFEFGHDGGLGLCCVGAEVPSPVRAICTLKEKRAAALRNAFFTLGSRLTTQLKADGLRQALGGLAQERQVLVAEARHRDAEVEQLDERMQALKAEIVQRGSLIDGLNSALMTKEAELSSIRASVGWALVQRYWRLRARWLPGGTRRGDAYERQRDRLLRYGRSPSTPQPGPVHGPVAAGRLSPIQAARPWEQPLTDVSRTRMGQRILIIAELTMPACKRYRVDQKVAMLERLGFDATVLDWRDGTTCGDAMQLHGLVIFYRVPAFASARRLAHEARRLGIPSFYDVDDLIFELGDYRESLEAQGLPRRERELTLEGARMYRDMLGLCQHGIGSTTLIARRMRGHVAGSVHTLENGLDDAILKLADELAGIPRSSFVASDVVTIGYGSGSRTHDADFALAAGALASVLERHSHVRLVIHGLLALPDALAQHADRIFRIPFLDADDYMRALAAWDINIAPLENTAFNQAKSNIKFIEAAAFCVPSVCSATQPFAAVIDHGRNGMLARNAREWEEALMQLVASESLRVRIGEAAHRTAMTRYHPAVLAAKSMEPVVAHLPAAVKPPRLKVVVANVLFAPLSFGGATIVAEQLARELATGGCDVTVFTGIMQPVLAPYQVVRYEALGLPVIAVQLPGGAEPALEHRNPAMKEIFKDALRALRPDVVHLHSVQWLSASLAEACSEEGIPYVITLHDAWWLCERQFMVREDQRFCGQKAVDLQICSRCVADTALTYRRSFYLRQVLKGAALLLTPSEFQRQLYIANGMPPDAVVVNKNGVLLPARPPARREPGVPVRFAYLGGRSVHKGYFWLKAIFEAMHESDYVLRITDIAQRMGPPSVRANEWQVGGRIEVTPPYDQSGMDEFFDSIDVLLVPSQWKESFGLAVREALARGLWVISTASGGVVEDIVDGVNGTIVAIDDANGFRDAIQSAIANPACRVEVRHPMARGIRDYPTQARELEHLLLRASRERCRPALREVARSPASAVVSILPLSAHRVAAAATPSHSD